MKKIVILEDDETIRNQLHDKVSSINSDIDIFATSSAKEAFKYLNDHEIGAFFLDIQVEDYSGLELAKKIRMEKKYQFTPIIFITAMLTRELEAFRQVHCYEYIIKPYTDEEIERVFRKILIDYMEDKQKDQIKKLALKFNGFTQLINMKDIIYVEYLSRKIIIITRDDVIEYIHQPLKKFKESLEGEFFLQIHQSIIINIEFIESIELSAQRIKMNRVNNKLPIGRSYLKIVGEKFNELY